MEITSTYFAKRRYLGKQPLFCETVPVLIDSIVTNIDEQKAYVLRNPVHREVQNAPNMSHHFVSTYVADKRNAGVNHTEGGWPKDVNYLDEEAVQRFRRRIERDDAYVDAVLRSYPKFIRTIKQNNALEIYEMYYKGMEMQPPVEKSVIFKMNSYRMPNWPISSISWTREHDTKLVVAYANQTYPIPPNVHKVYDCCIWDLNNSSEPVCNLTPPACCWNLTGVTFDPNIFLGGLQNGRVCVFDIRAKAKAVNMCPAHVAHNDPVSALEYIKSRTNSEFFTGSLDGQCLWWDLRNLDNYVEQIIMTVRLPPGETANLSNSEPVTTLSYERALPTRYLCGTDTGKVINVNRKGKSLNETMSAVYQAHSGPIKALHRSPLTTKMFLTCGDWAVHIWSDDILSSPLVTGTSHRYTMNDAAFAPERLSAYMCANSDGNLRYYDLLRRYKEPLAIKKISKYPLMKVVPHRKGHVVAVGDSYGTVYALGLSENLMYSEDKDKQLMTQIYEREHRREHILEVRVKEIRLKLKMEEETAPEADEVEVLYDDAMLKNVEEEYRKVVHFESKNLGFMSDTNSRSKEKSR